MRPTLSAIFIDFDNIYLSLREQDDRAAQAFAAPPGRWLEPLRSMPDQGPEPARERTFIIRRCYANPSRFSKYRAYFTRSAFEVIDCPPLTGGGRARRSACPGRGRAGRHDHERAEAAPANVRSPVPRDRGEVAGKPLALGKAAKAIRRKLEAEAVDLSLTTINFVLKGMHMQPGALAEGEHLRALNEDEKALLEKWIRAPGESGLPF